MTDHSELLADLRLRGEHRAADVINNLFQQLQAAQRNAARYMWIRDCSLHIYDSGPAVCMTDKRGRPWLDENGYADPLLGGADLDKAIDAAMLPPAPPAALERKP